jgi:hypothetical protein
VDIQTREFDYEKDLAHVKRIWREVGWVEDDDDEKQLDHFFAVGRTLVGTIDGIPECSVHITPGTMRLLQTDLSLCAVTAVTTSRIARGHQFAQRLTAAQLRQGAEEGAAVAALGMFDQGFYDKLGFGTGGYDHEFSFDPAALAVDIKPRTPKRLTADDYADMHRALVGRPRHHGSVVLHPDRLLRAEIGFESDGFGLGYTENDQLTHFVWLDPEGERGPYTLRWLGYQDTDQLMELLALVKSLADQVYSAIVVEPADVQFQSLLTRPFRGRVLTRNSKHSSFHRAAAWAQLRILDVARCIEALRWASDDDLVFALEVSDPVVDFLEDGDWRGVGGSYVVRLGSQCSAVPGDDRSLPRVTSSVNALSRLLWGVASASSLSVTDDLSAPADLLASLDDGLRLPSPRMGWDF